MDGKGRLVGMARNLATGKVQVTFQMDSDVSPELSEYDESTPLRITAKKWREKRSLNANGLLWHCIDQIAQVLHTDKWQVYMELLKVHGKFTYILVHKEAVDAVKSLWRECEEIGEVDVHGKKAVQLLCYYGSSTYDTKEFSVLLDDTIDEMKNLGLEPPPSSEMRRSLEEWDKLTTKKEET